MKSKMLLRPFLYCCTWLAIAGTKAQQLNYQEDFSRYPVATSPASIKTNGVAMISKPSGQAGHWLLLKDKATYKFTNPMQFPKDFSLEFDLLLLADQVNALSPVSFGFTKDNSVKEYISNNGAFVELHYYDANAVNIGSSHLGTQASATFDLSSTLNRILHVRLIVKGTRMSVYLGNTKLADTTLFSTGDAKYFYISGPWEYEDETKLYISNFKIKSPPVNAPD